MNVVESAYEDIILLSNQLRNAMASSLSEISKFMDLRVAESFRIAWAFFSFFLHDAIFAGIEVVV